MRPFLAVLGRMVRTVLLDDSEAEDCSWGEAVRWALQAFGLLFLGIVAATG